MGEKFICGGTPSTNKKKYWNGKIHWTNSKRINGIYLLDGEKKITNKGLGEREFYTLNTQK